MAPACKHKRRYPGTRWSILFGSCDGSQRFALNEFQRSWQHHLPSDR